MFGEIPRAQRREKSRPTRKDGSKFTQPPIAARVRRRRRFKGRKLNGLPMGLVKTPPLPEEVREREKEKKEARAKPVGEEEA